MRRRNKSSDSIATLSRPDIRTLYILFILSFIDKETPSPVKTAFLEQHRDAITSIFKGLNQDSYPVIERVLQVCWEGLWLDQRVKRTLKIGIFGESTIAHLIKLYDRSVPEKEGGLCIPADVVHHFLLAICSRPGQGICFKDRGWYPRETDETVALDEEERTQRKGGGKLYNKILANVLPTLKVNEDPRQQELALKIFLACPELVAGYWSTAALTFEPRLSSKWIANIAFAGQVLSQAVPSCSFLMLGTTEHNPTPPPLSVILSNVLPAVGTKAYFTKGLQAGVAGLVQHCTALTLVKCLRKLGEVVHAFKMVSVALEEDEDEGQWCRRRKEVEREARRRVPEFQVIVAFSQQYLSSSNTQNTTKHALLSESSQRLLWLYQEYLPDVVAEARFEVGKLVLTFVDGSLLPLSEDATGDPSLQCSPLQNVKQLHVLRLLNASEQFTWTGKIASSPRTYFQVLLTTLCNTSVCALQTTLSTLLRRVLTESVLFQEDPDEVDLWLASLPSGSLRRGSGTETPDGALLTDEVNSVVTFLDDCTQRCLKTPYRYMEAMSDLLQPNDAQSSDAVLTNSGVGMFASPLLMAVVEQTLAKVNGRLLTPSDALSVFTFFRRLVVKLATKQEDIGYHALRIITQKLEEPVMGEDFFADYPSIRNAIQRELSIAEASLDHFGSNSPPHRPEDDDTVGAFLNNIEKVPVPESEKARMASAFELVDWLRLADVTPTSSDISRLVAVIRRFHQPTLKVLAYFLHPAEGQLWDLSVLNALDNLIDFDWLFIHCSEVQLADELLRDRLVRALLSRQVVPSAVGGAMRLVLHGVTISKNQPYLTKDLLLLLSDLLRGAMENLGREDMEKIKAIVLTQSSFYELCLSNNLSPEIHEGISHIVL
ncbi:hypothetical protein ID866_8017 [Astraeus odoratus]|nr:hypothetical protein ID866_8017 [Astraeus odoratus]